MYLKNVFKEYTKRRYLKIFVFKKKRDRNKIINL